MVDKKYNNVILNNQEIVTPQGNIGVMINGIPITNNLEFSDTITEEIVENGFLFEVNRNLNQATQITFIRIKLTYLILIIMVAQWIKIIITIIINIQ